MINRYLEQREVWLSEMQKWALSCFPKE